jgi:hypothetical protein
MANHLLYIPLHLIQSELSQKEEAKPREQSFRESSQGRAAMPGREVASLPSLMGSPLGRYGGRASPFRAKSVASPCPRSRRAVRLVSGVLTLPVRPAIPKPPPHRGPSRGEVASGALNHLVEFPDQLGGQVMAPPGELADLFLKLPLRLVAHSPGAPRPTSHCR